MRGAPVATFTAYWKEKLAIGTVNFRYRLFKISIDMDDGEMIFSEQKTSNSGLPQVGNLTSTKSARDDREYLMQFCIKVFALIPFHISLCRALSSRNRKFQMEKADF